MPTCCVGESLCGRKDFDPTKNHPCMNCRGYAHGLFCCYEWTSRADHGISITDDDAKKVKDPILPSAMVTHINSNPSKSDICKKCSEIVKGLLSAPVSTPATTSTTNSSARVTAATPASANAADDVLAAAAPLPPSTASTAKKSKGGGVVDLTSDAPKKKKTKQTQLKPILGGNGQQKSKPKKKQVRFSNKLKIETV